MSKSYRRDPEQNSRGRKQRDARDQMREYAFLRRREALVPTRFANRDV